MRPRKVILLVDADERQAGQTKFVLDLRNYRVLVAHDAAAALALHALGVDLVLGAYLVPGMEWGELAESMKRRDASTPILWLCTDWMVKDPAPAVTQALPARISMGELLERIRVQIARKRGPRKMPVLVPVAVAGD